MRRGHPTPVGVGLKIRPERYPIEVHKEIWRIADEAGFDHVWSYDHLVAVGKDVAAPIFEGWSLLAAIAATTSRTRLGLMVTGNLYRHPAVLAKMAVTVDHVSNGRLEMGIGAGWNEPEFTMLGMAYPSARERIERLDETCTILKLLWTGVRPSFEGRYYSLEQAIAYPQPVQRPHPPIWIGGSGPKRTLPLVARHADVWNPNGSTVDENLSSSRALDAVCEDIDRDPTTLRRCAQLFWTDVESTCREAEAYVAAGFTELIVVIHPDRLREDADPVAIGELIASQALPRLRSI